MNALFIDGICLGLDIFKVFDLGFFICDTNKGVRKIVVFLRRHLKPNPQAKKHARTRKKTRFNCNFDSLTYVSKKRNSIVTFPSK